MTTTPYAVPAPATHPPAPAGPASSRLLLWLPVVSLSVMTWLLIEGDSAISAGAVDLDPLYGLATGFIAVVGGGLAAVALLLALIFSFTSPASRVSGALVTAVLAAALGLVHVAFVVWATATEPMLSDSATAGAQYPWQLAAALVTLVPLVALLVVRVAKRS